MNNSRYHSQLHCAIFSYIQLEYNQETNWFYGYHNILQEEKIVKELKIFKSDDHFERTYGMLINLIYIKNDILSLYIVANNSLVNVLCFLCRLGMAIKITPGITSDDRDGWVQGGCSFMDICFAGIKMKFVLHLNDE